MAYTIREGAFRKGQEQGKPIRDESSLRRREGEGEGKKENQEDAALSNRGAIIIIIIERG